MGEGGSSDLESAPPCQLPLMIPGASTARHLQDPIHSALSPRDLQSSPLGPGDQPLSSRIPREPQPFSPGPTPPCSHLPGYHAASSPATLSLSPQCSRPEQAPGTQREAPCKPSSPHGAGHCTPQPPTGRCHQAQPPHVSIGHWEALLGLGEYRPTPPTQGHETRANLPSHAQGSLAQRTTLTLPTLPRLGPASDFLP